MEAVTFGSGLFSLRGTCPYPNCRRQSAFMHQTGAHVGQSPQDPHLQRIVAIMQCLGCRNYILAIVDYQPGNPQGHFYREHYPLGAPDQTVADEIPDHIKEDFKEALRCMFVDAYNATAEMCRRALESTCLDLEAPKDKVLEKMIDWLEANRKITPYLKEAAHKVRLGGNRGAHPNPDGPAAPDGPALADAPIEKIEKEHAEAIIAFTREFFHHVYVGPKLLGKYDFSKPKAPKP